ncbi:cleft lip and palate transmembrane protein 1 protein [Cyclospora cayetanensis]|uniref:Cleft lip and palate transmembrane protein 1 protein n=1 Tax=Cyclospora cayetanensis TaxID=88456 RepID=A0A1D3CYT6_9EIME|nr:cleft lip and palate transmembrane protein 1 protein [Cyclospora cayetanensis]
MHLHYLPSPPPLPSRDFPENSSSALGEAPADENPQLGLLDMYKARLGMLQPPPADEAALAFWGRMPLQTLMSPPRLSHYYCPSTSGTVTADRQPEADTAAISAEAAETQAALSTQNSTLGDKAVSPPTQESCASPRLLPAPIEAWRVLSAKYTYDWWSRSEEKTLQISLQPEFLDSEDLVLALTVTVVPYSAYDANRHEPKPCLIAQLAWKSLDVSLLQMSPEEAVAAAAALPEERLIQRTTSLVQKMKPFKNEEEEHSLLLGGDQDTANTDDQTDPIRHLKSRLDVSLVYDTSVHSAATLSTGPLQGLQLRLAAGEYEPMVNISDFWLLEKHFVPINATLVDVPQNITLSFGVGSVHAWLLQSQMTGVQQQQVQMGIQSAREGFMLKRILLETNPFMLAFSAVFILCHSVFSFFAFKNDMQFWYKNESMEGLSAVSLIFGFVCELIIGLYLFDSQETSWLILFEVFIGIAISGWKLTKAVKLERRHDFPFVRFSFTRSYSDSQTKDYDRTAITYASIALAPCAVLRRMVLQLVGYAVYALLNNKYKSWYSYIISVLAGSVYTFGFVLMTPQLYINYKLKSLNTFVDDVASFLIDMPWMHRLSCFRDDIIFIVYLYQRWIYRVDKSRTMGAQLQAASQQSAAAGDDAASAPSTAAQSSEAAKAAASPGVQAASEAVPRVESIEKDKGKASCTEAEGLRRRQPQTAGAPHS